MVLTPSGGFVELLGLRVIGGDVAAKGSAARVLFVNKCGERLETARWQIATIHFNMAFCAIRPREAPSVRKPQSLMKLPLLLRLQEPLQSGSNGIGVGGVKVYGSLASYLGERRSLRTSYWGTAGHRLQNRKSKPFLERRQYRNIGTRICHSQR